MKGGKSTAFMKRRRRRRARNKAFRVKQWGNDVSMYPRLKYSPLNVKQKVLVKYQDHLTLNGGIGTANVDQFRANGLYDPYVGAGGHQPRGFDQLMALYDHFTVISATIHVDFANMDTSNPYVCFVSLKDSTAASTSLNDYLEDDRTKYVILGPKVAGSDIKSIQLHCNPNKFLGRSKPLADPDLKGSSGADPTEQAFFHIGVRTLDPAVDGANVLCNVVINYVAILTEPKQPAQS